MSDCGISPDATYITIGEVPILGVSERSAHEYKLACV